ncbi:ribosomal protein S19 family protein, partial [Rhodobacteraceae bacterium NNCM2]|nr:ribosomal protein S19 family protein [Coraliihabitans acroporae]
MREVLRPRRLIGLRRSLRRRLHTTRLRNDIGAKKLRKAKQEAQPNEKPDLVKTHLRDMIVVPEMIG